MATVLKWIGEIVMGLVGGADESGDFNASDSASDSQQQSESSYDITEMSGSRGELGNTVITGVLENKTGSDVSYVQVEINFYDDEEVQVGSTMANTNNLSAGGKWRFEAMATVSDFDRYEVEGVSGF